MEEACSKEVIQKICLLECVDLPMAAGVLVTLENTFQILPRGAFMVFLSSNCPLYLAINITHPVHLKCFYPTEKQLFYSLTCYMMENGNLYANLSVGDTLMKRV